MAELPEFPPLPTDYESWSAQRKQDFLWNERILKSQYEQLPPLEKIDVVGVFLTPLSIKMNRLADEAPRRWKKALHAHASVAKVKFIPTNNTPFTGLFKGADYGVLRLSLTGDPSDRGFAPGFALKLLIDGHPSANFSALVSLTGQGKNYNFFANEMSNIVPVEDELGPRLMNWIFSRVTRFPTKLYLQDLAQIDQQGNKITNPYYPEQIFLVPNPSLHFSESPHDFREDLAKIATGRLLFSVYAVNPEKLKANAGIVASMVDQTEYRTEYRKKAQLIGSLSATSAFVASYYGDDLLFFRHQRFDNR